ncbi:DUF6428 family protein [Cognatishimia maritima]|uniref:Uncharacterized protein n=1 Tax=Cognatishimia maritima TaxID=870908 RepID=A0A1M5L5R3_9RHOB|nr:DUF6428 family protein [Cognatishimia maritima]SHG60129.1 hypothetical protein SAMN04488044_1165 [Cognatishimia maritima]
MHLNDLADFLAEQPADFPVVYHTADATIGAGYHLTELKSAPVTSIDCGGNVARFSEVTMQLLDGRDGAYMKAGKLLGILRHSLKEIPALNDAEARVEFSHSNNGLELFALGEPKVDRKVVTLPLIALGAQCKPAVAARSRSVSPAQSGCCGAASGSGGGCC